MWENATYFHLLRGTLDVLDGGALTTGQMLLAQPANANAAVTVSGASSTLVTTAANDIEVGRDGNAALTIADGGAVTVRGGAGTVHIATRAGSSSTVNIGGASGQAAERAGTLDAELIQFGAGTGTFNFNHTNSDYSFTPTFSGEGTINHAGSGKTVLNTDNSSFTGVTNINAGTLAVNDVLGGTVNVNNGRLQGVGTLGTTTHEANGIIAPGNSIGTLTINGNYVGNGGLVEIESVLGDDSSATDLLRITGDTSGTGNVRIINVGGTGALTTEGIQVISVAGASDGVFSLNGNYVINGEQAVVGGAYAYQLYKGNHSGSDANGWYLRSELKPVDPVNPIDPTPPVTPPAPLYQPSVPIVEAYPHALLGLNGLNTLQQRVGNRFWAGNGNRVIAQGADAIQPYAAPEEAGVYADGNGVWGRIEGGHDRINSHFSTSDTDYNQNVFKMQAGVDGLLSEAANGSLIGGVFAQYVHGKTKTNSVYGDGEISTDGYGFGGTLTWYGNEGFYIDGQAQATWYESDLNSTRANLGVIGDNKGFGYAFSVESGKRFALTPEWSVTPQAQLVYSNVHFDSFTDVFGADVRLDKGDSLQGRLGITLDHENSWQNTNGLMNRAHVYGIANLYYEFLEGTRVDVAGVSFASQKDRLWGGLGVGGSYNWDNDRYSIYGEGLVNTSLADFGDSYSVKGNVGFRVKW